MKEIEAYELPEDKSKALEDLRNFSTRFNEAGLVPMKVKNEIYNAYKKAMDGLYSKLKIEGEEKETIMFEAKIETLKGSPNAARLLNNLKFDLRKEIDKQKKEIVQLENNLGFFANSKGAETLKKEVEKKVKRAHDKIEMIKKKIKMIPNE